MIQYFTLAFLTLTGLAYGQEIIIPPADITAVVGSTISFFCRVGFGPIETMSWEFNEAIVFSLQDGFEHYPCTSCRNKYAVTRNGGNFTLHVNALDLNDGGKYTCIAMVPSATAALIVLDTPQISKSTLSSAESTIAEYTCKAQFARPPKNEILPERNPVLKMFLAGDTLIGEAREENCDGLKNCYYYTQTEDLTLEASMNGKQLMCDISTSQPSMHVNSSTTITVLYSVRNISYTPDDGQYEIGTKITCLADGNPKPQYVWNNMNTGESIDGQTLYMAEEMMGPNTWRCIAKNDIDENPYKEITEIDFTVVMPGDYKEAGNASLGIGLGVTFAVCVLAIILTFLYCRIKYKKLTCHTPIKEKDEESKSHPNKSSVDNEREDAIKNKESKNQPKKSNEGNGGKESEMKASRAAKKRVLPILKNKKEDNADSAESTKPLLLKASLPQKPQDHVEKVHKTKSTETAQKMVLPLIKNLTTKRHETQTQESQGPRGENSPGDASDSTHETKLLSTKNDEEDNNTDESKDEYSKQQSFKLQKTIYSGSTPGIQEQDIQDPKSSEHLLPESPETNNKDADDLQDRSSRPGNSDGSLPLLENVESSTFESDGVDPNVQNNEDNQNSKSGNTDSTPSENGDQESTAETEPLNQGHLVPEKNDSSTSDGDDGKAEYIEINQSSDSANTDGSPSENGNKDCTEGTEAHSQVTQGVTPSQVTTLEDQNSNHSSNNEGKINNEEITPMAEIAATAANSQSQQDKTHSILCDSDVSKSMETPAVPIYEANKESQSTEEVTDESLDNGKSKTNSDNQKGNKKVEVDVVETSDQKFVTSEVPPIPPLRLKNEESIQSLSDGFGHFGEILSATQQDNKVTIFRCKEFQTEDQRKSFYDGSHLLRKYKHENIAKFIKITGTEKTATMVLKYEPGGVLQQFLQEHGKYLNTFHLIKICENVLNGMIYLEAHPCIHRALGARSCLAGDNNTVKIFNFSWAREGKVFQGDSDEQVPFRSSSPEALEHGLYSCSSDVWSYGVLVWEIFSYGKAPYGKDGETKEKLLSWLKRGYILKTPEGTPSSISKLSETCFKTDPKRRPSSRVLAIKIKDAYKS